MRLTVEAIYEDGVLKPVQTIALSEGTRVSLVIETVTETPTGQSAAAILAAIAALPSDNPSFSIRDHHQEN